MFFFGHKVISYINNIKIYMSIYSFDNSQLL
jgi:hypothetical protein